jgi:hypothetical protein
MDDRTAGMSQTGLVGSEPAPSGGFLDSEEIVAALDCCRSTTSSLKEVEKVFLQERTCQPGSSS